MLTRLFPSQFAARAAVLFAALFLALVVTAFSGSAQAENPIVTDNFTADPTARVFNGRLYVYTSHDVRGCQAGQGDSGFCMPDYRAYSTTDLVNWTDHGVVLSQNDVRWVRPNSFGMWAPDVIEKNGRYFMFFPAPPSDRSSFRRIGVAESDNPNGPFQAYNTYIEGPRGIDPGVLVDADGSAYLYWALGGEIKAAKLFDDFSRVVGKQVDVPLPSGYKEGPFPTMRNGQVYLSFPRVGSTGYEIDYATSSNPLGPFDFRGVVMPNIANGTNHHSLVDYKGKSYIFYHDFSISGNQKLRNIRADEFSYDANGGIRQTSATIRGVGTPGLGDIIQIDRNSDINGARINPVRSPGEPFGYMVDYIRNGHWVRYDRVNFANGANSVALRVSSATAGGVVEIRVDGPNGRLLGKVDIGGTGGWNNWTTVTSQLDQKVTDQHDLYVRFTGPQGHLLNLNWLRFG